VIVNGSDHPFLSPSYHQYSSTNNINNKGQEEISRGDFVIAKVTKSRGITLEADPISKSSILEYDTFFSHFQPKTKQ